MDKRNLSSLDHLKEAILHLQEFSRDRIGGGAIHACAVKI